MNIDKFMPILKVIEISTCSIQNRRMEELAQGNDVTAVATKAIAQMVQMWATLHMAQMALDAVKQPPIGQAIKIVLTLTPAALAGILLKNDIIPETIRPYLLSIKEHIGTLCQTASAVAAVALCALGSPVLGGTSLAIFGLGGMMSKGYLSNEACETVGMASVSIYIATGFLSGDIVMPSIILLGFVGKKFA